ncbi:MAG: methyl-accepting chemotaxis protein [gamma proteobacterium symbiont of Lucinoma myriamae]|nr:methyl-accepting chemotaxis protein [gamma proteobacterium symbiont of Lucinoma myriamae]MCU7819683.1 methyl-accepting chemotaxis protein [gamma proteobacterium symbiont of Lucinoma myriamae]MCU7831560.1 methyl-accepting chemotaxis protein [gamma proteobacterium symbiont of Lucinoma myriamae]
MNIKTKVLLGSGLLSIIPLLVVSMVIGWQSIDKGEKALQEQIQNRLIALRDDKKAQIENYFKITTDQLITFSKDQMFIDASLSFKDAFTNFNDEFIDETPVSDYKITLQKFCQQDFNKGFSKLNSEKPPALNNYVNKLSEQAISLQTQYLVTNKAPLMAKDQLLNPDDDTLYAQIHSLYHNKFKEFKNRFLFSDIYFVDPETGNIIYSVSKKIDFASSLIDGPLAQSELGKVFNKANQATKADFVSLTDFSPYLPSLNQASAFIASPIFDDEEKTGILIFQLNTKVINQIMTSNKKWPQVGMGDTGESYLVGSDLLARSIDRRLVENSENYFSLIKQTGMNQKDIDNIKSKKTNVLIQSIKTPGTQNAFSGKAGFSQYSNSLSIPVLSAYSSIKIANLNWAIISEISVAEAFSPVEALKKTIATSALSVFLIMLTLSVIAGLLFSRMITRPIIHLSNVIKEIEQTSDLTKRINMNHNDEIGSAANAFDNMLLKFHNSLQEVSHTVHYFTNATNILKEHSNETNSTINRQNEQTSQIASSINQMMDKSRVVTEHTEFASKATHQTRGDSQKGQQSVLSTIKAINQVASQIEQSAVVIHQLESDSDNIGSVVNVIKSIAEQTNLLALNAAIEAARAGESGRGFAVVADEVRQLASRTQDATTEIQSLIERLQLVSKDAVKVMDASKTHILSSVKQAKDAGEVLNTVTHSIESIDKKNQLIKEAVAEQADLSTEINHNIEIIIAESQKTSASSLEIKTSSEVLSELSDNLQGLVDEFKIEELPPR